MKWHPRRSRGVQARYKPSQRARKSDNPGFVRRETTATTDQYQAKSTQNDGDAIANYYNPNPDKLIGSVPLQDYQIQLMLLEQQNKARLQMKRQEYDEKVRTPEQDSTTSVESQKIGSTRVLLRPKVPVKRIPKSHSSGVVPPPLSTSASALLSAGASGPPNPFARPHPVSQTSQTNSNDGNMVETPVSALPSRFLNNEFLPPPSSFYPDWNLRDSD